MRVLVCLLSDQHVPNLLSVHHFKPNRLVLVESAGMRRRSAAENFLAALKLGGLDYKQAAASQDNTCRVELLEDENDFVTIRGCLENVVRDERGEEWIVNLTGGTKPMSLAAYDVFGPLNSRLVYAPVNKPDCFLDLRGGPACTCSYRPSIEEFLAGYGFVFHRRLESIVNEENMFRFLPALAQRIAVNCPQGLVQLADRWSPEKKQRWWKRAREKGATLEPGDMAIPNDALRDWIARAFRLGVEGECVVGYLASRAARFLTGGWLEVLLWDLLKRHADRLEVWDVHMGLEVRPTRSHALNELDVAFMRRHTLSWIECKSGSQFHDAEADILYKIEAVTRQFGALRVQAFLATTGDNVLETDSAWQSRVKRHVEQRAGLYQCRIVTRGQIQRLAEQPDDAELVRSTFFPSGPETS